MPATPGRTSGCGLCRVIADAPTLARAERLSKVRAQPATMAATNKCLARTNKSHARALCYPLTAGEIMSSPPDNNAPGIKAQGTPPERKH